MSVYRSIYTTFWSDSKINDSFSPEDKYFYLYLLTNQFTNICGCYEVSIKHMANDLGYDTDTVRKLIKRMTNEHKVIDYDEETKEILIPNWHKYNWTKSPKLIKSVAEVAKYIKTERFKKYILSIIEALQDEKNDTVSIPYPYPMDTSVSVSDTVYNSISYRETNSLDSSIDIKSRVKTKEQTEEGSILERDFLTFWEAYPRHTNTSKKETFKKFCKAIQKTDLQTMLNAIELQKQTKQWKDGYIPMPTTWLNQEKWEDDVDIPAEKPKRIYTETEKAWLAADWLSRKLHSMYPTISELKPEILQVWASVFDRMENEDNHSAEEILALMKFAFQDDFWCTKITSPWELRKHYVKLLAQAKKERWL